MTNTVTLDRKEYSFSDDPPGEPFIYLIFNVKSGIQVFDHEDITGVIKIVDRRSKCSKNGAIISYCSILYNPQVTLMERFYYRSTPSLIFDILASTDALVCFIRDSFPGNAILKQMDDKLVAITFLKMLQSFIGRKGPQTHIDILHDLFQTEIDFIEAT